MRVGSDKQTLILAGEATPRRRADANRTSDADRSANGSQLQRVTMLLVQGEYAAGTLAADSSQAKFLAAADSERGLLASAAAVDVPPVSAQSVLPHPTSGRAPSAAAAQYARMQNLSGASSRIRLIDTYA